MEGLFVSSRLYKYQTGEIAPVFGAYWIYYDFEQDLFVNVKPLTKLHVVS